MKIMKTLQNKKFEHVKVSEGKTGTYKELLEIIVLNTPQTIKTIQDGTRILKQLEKGKDITLEDADLKNLQTFLEGWTTPPMNSKESLFELDDFVKDIKENFKDG